MSPHEFKHALVAGLPIRHQPVAAIPEPVLAAMARAASDPSRHFARASSSEPLARSSMDYNQVLCSCGLCPSSWSDAANTETMVVFAATTMCVYSCSDCKCIASMTCSSWLFGVSFSADWGLTALVHVLTLQAVVHALEYDRYCKKTLVVMAGLDEERALP